MEDREQVMAAQRGDRQAFGELAACYHRFVYRLCWRMTGNTADAEDLAQEALVEAYLKLPALRDPARFAGWLRTLTLNLCRMWHRERRRDSAEPSDALEELPAAEEGTPSGYARVASGLAQLSPAHRTALVLHYLEGLSYEEMARFLQVPAGTVMSRLHRARAALKELVERMPEDEDAPNVTDEQIRREVDAEAAVLARLSGEKAGAGERLSVLLRRSPERLAQLIQQTDDDAVLGHLGWLLPRLGPGAIDAVLEAYGHGDDAARRHAAVVVRQAMARAQAPVASGPGWGRMPSRQTYRLLDRVIDARLSAAERAGVVLDVMSVCDDAPTAALLSCLLMCWPDEAFPILWERFCRADTPDELYGPPHVLYALCRTASRFAAALRDLLPGGDARRQALALAGVEALARSVDHPWLDDATPEQWQNEVRTRLKWPPLRWEDIGEEALRSLADATAALLPSEDPTVRDAAIRALGHLKDREHAPAIRACLRRPEPSTQVAAVLALAEMGDAGSADLLLETAADMQSPARQPAVEALGRLGVREAQPLLLGLLGDPDPSVRRAAVVALGEVGDDEARAALRALLRGPDRQLAKAAGSALYGGVKGGGPHGPASALHQRLLQSETPLRPASHISVDAAIRFALPEVRAYEERELTRRLAGACWDYSSVRRYLVEQGLMERAAGVYWLTELGMTVWRVEHFVIEHYLSGRAQ